MAEYFHSTVAEVVALFAVLVGLLIVAFYLIDRSRGGALEQRPQSSDQLTIFRELHSKGELSDEEYRTIKSMLSDKLQEELNSTEEKG